MSAQSVFDIIDTFAEIQEVEERPFTGNSLLDDDEGFLYQFFSGLDPLEPENIKKSLNAEFKDNDKETKVSIADARLLGAMLDAQTELLSTEEGQEFEISDGATLAQFLQKFGNVSVSGASSQPAMPVDVAYPGQTPAVTSGLFNSVPPTSGSNFTAIAPIPNSVPVGDVDHVVASLNGNLNSSKSRVINFKFELENDQGVKETVFARFAIPAKVTNGLYTSTMYTVPHNQWTPQMIKMQEFNFEAVKAKAAEGANKALAVYSDGEKLDAYYIQEMIGVYGDPSKQLVIPVEENKEKPTSASRRDMPAPVPKMAAPANTIAAAPYNAGTTVSVGDWPAPPPAFNQNDVVKVMALNPASFFAAPGTFNANNVQDPLVKVWQHKGGLPLIAFGKAKGGSETAYYWDGGNIKKGQKNYGNYAPVKSGKDYYGNVTGANQKLVVGNMMEFIRAKGGENYLRQNNIGYFGAAPAPVSGGQQPWSGNRPVNMGNTGFNQGGNAFTANNFTFTQAQQQPQQAFNQQQAPAQGNAQIFAYQNPQQNQFQQPIKNDPFAIPQQPMQPQMQQTQFQQPTQPTQPFNQQQAYQFGTVNNAMQQAQQAAQPPQQPMQQMQQAPAQNNANSLFVQPTGQTLAPAQPQQNMQQGQIPMAAPPGAVIQNATAPNNGAAGGFSSFPI